MRIAEVAFPLPLHRGFDYEVPPGLAVSAGVRVRAPFGPRILVGTVLSVREAEPTRKLKNLSAVLDHAPALSPELLELARWMSNRFCAPIGECLRSLFPGAVKSSRPRPEEPAVMPEKPPAAPRGFNLTAGQEAAVARLSLKLESRSYGAALLFGVPASGKTEVYLRLIRRALEGGGQALFMVPEISLTVPFFEDFTNSLDCPVVLWHSQLGDRQRRQAWLAVQEGRVKVVVGARSAVLLPYKDLRLAVLDEEQDESYKQEESGPPYHARDVAIARAKTSSALVVLGSATPSMETWEAVRRGEVELLSLPDRVSATARPNVKVLPMPQWGKCISEELLDRIGERWRLSEQSILLVNRRGFSTLVMCHHCGWVDRCASCGVAMISHQAKEGGFLLRCHHCSRTKAQSMSCPSCSKTALRVMGTGTQKVVAELKARLPGIKVLRMDRDTLSQGSPEDRRIYERFRDRQADVLVGTKLVAKSFHFPEVTLVGVVDADTMIHMPDFRSSERTMQLLAQVTGRSGRAQKPGSVLIQTLHPEHYAIESAASSDYQAFAEKELEFRRELRYPPFSTLVRLLWSAPKEEAVEEAARDMSDRLRSELSPEGHDLVGPAPALPAVFRGRHRRHLLMKVYDAAGLESACAKVHSLVLPSSVKLKINVDPYDLF